MMDSMDLCCATHEFLPRDTPLVSSQHVSCHSVPSDNMLLLLVAHSTCGHSVLADNTALGQIMCLVDITGLFQLLQRRRGRKGAVFLDQFPTVYHLKTDLTPRCSCKLVHQITVEK